MILESRFDDPLRGKTLADQQSCSKTNQTLLGVHLQWYWKGQLGSHGLGCDVETLVDAKEMEEVSRGTSSGSTAFVLPEQCVEIVRFA